MKEKIDKFDVVCVCVGKDCKKWGAKDIYLHFKKMKHLKGSNRRIKLVKTKCLDYCKKAPVFIEQGVIHFKGKF
jgi:NADH-quinone oxidoreductase subunit F